MTNEELAKMPELIDRQELIADYRICGGCSAFENCSGHITMCDSARIRQAINEAPTIEPEVRHGRWISVEDALPDALQNVLVCTDINTVTVAWINGEGWTFADTGNGHTENWGFDDVKYWMHLPEPPKGEQK